MVMLWILLFLLRGRKLVRGLVLFVERLVNNLCTVWIDRFKLHANIARFHRSPVDGNNSHVMKDVGITRSNSNVFKKDLGDTGVGNSYVHVVKGNTLSGFKESDSSPAIAFVYECLYSKDLSNSLLGRVKEFASLSNLKTALTNEGFVDIIIHYMGNYGGGLLDTDDQDDKCFHSKRLCIHTRLGTNIFEAFKIIFRGKVFWIRAKEVHGWVPDFLEEYNDEDQSENGSKDGDPKTHDLGSCGGDSDVSEVSDTLFEKKGQKNDKLDEESTGQKVNHLEDPFGIYPLLNKKKDTTETNNNLEQSLKYPPGFTPNEDSDAFCINVEDDRNNNCDYSQGCNVEEANNGSKGNCVNMGSKIDVAESVCSGHFKKSEAPRTGGSILNLMKELVKVRQTMRYNMDGDSVGNSGGILCVWDPNSFRKNNVTVSDYFILIWGVWLKTGNGLLVVAVYAPRDLKDKRMLFGLVFNVQGANVFNSFIVNVGLEEVPLGGSVFTWCHKSATKMSKLDRFLIFENLLITCPNITAITLERYLSDHRPILLRESQFDYGPTPFCFFHHWLDVEGFNKIVEDAWSESPCDHSYAMISMMKKLKYLKLKIQEWNKGNMKNMKNVKAKHKRYLKALETTIDKGEGTDEVVNARMEVVKSLQNIDKLQALEMAQKAKVQWSIEGDENSRFYHGVLNKKRSQLNIRGIMVDGIWTESPNMVKSKIFHHFRSRFNIPIDSRVQVDMRFWKIIENDVFEAVKQFFTYGDIPKGCNSCFIALILKISDANLVKDFRPISLIGNRQILDGPFILNEVLQWFKLKKKQSLNFKVDFEKAYDSVRWDFLDKVLRRFGFGDKWGNWIQSRLRSSRGSIIINGSPTEEFKFFKGLKQGDMLSLFLFILIMKSLHLSFQRMVDAGLQINMSKSKIIGVLVESDKVKCVASKLGCLILKTPFSYLGTEVGGSMSRIQAWNEVVDKVKARLSKWKMKALSIGGRGGLGVSSLYALNRGLMCKWIWRFYTHNTSLWARVIKAIHRDNGKVRKAVHTGIQSCWMNIVHEINILENQGINLFDSMSVKLDDGNKIALWEDKWVGGNAFKDLFPRMYALETCKSVSVGSKLADTSLDSSFCRKPRGGVEQDQYDALSDQVHDVILVSMSDRLPEVATKTRWIKYVPIKVNMHAWKVKIDSLPTRFNISRRGIDIESIVCSICSNGVESSSHLFFSCSIVRLLARKITHLWDVPYEEVNSYKDWITWLVNLRLPSKHKMMLEGVFYVMWWHLWSYRNKLLFDSKAPSKAVLFDDVVSRSFYWCHYRCKASFNWNDWLKNLYLVCL
nr:RNA-directed DNA polymerase, eukaryota [Tanacetum cinerariifolium]